MLRSVLNYKLVYIDGCDELHSSHNEANSMHRLYGVCYVLPERGEGDSVSGACVWRSYIHVESVHLPHPAWKNQIDVERLDEEDER